MRYMTWLGVLGFAVAGCATDADETDPDGQTSQVEMRVSAAVMHDISPPLRDMVPFVAPKPRADREFRHIALAGKDAGDPVAQIVPGPKASATTLVNTAGVGAGDLGFSPDAAPPDTNGTVGTTQFVQWVNESFAVFDKTTGAVAAGFPKRGNTIWAGFGGGCEINNDGDPIVQFDKAAQRWILTQFSVSTTPFLQCVAVSTTSDATGSYARYAFAYTAFPDYPKLAVWPDAYYITFNMFTSSFIGAQACAYDRAKMIAGQAATQVCFQNGTSVASLLPSDLDGSTAPPVGSPNFLLTLQTTTSVNLFKFHVDFANPAASTFSGPTAIAVASFATACRGGGACIPQNGTSQQLDSLSDRLMYRLAYRNFGNHEALVANHSVSIGSGKNKHAAVRWYELRSPGNGTFSIFQQATFSPDNTFRFMGSIAMDKVGDIALGYSASSSAIHPAIRYAVRAPTDAAGILSAEVSIKEGGGSQLTGLNRWGDYSALTVDPIDDCTFFYTNEYLKANGTFNWSIQFASFKIVGCQ
jgi:hypothetical protein